tara:strand:- start:307 stop:951 length:645 start_codon:yes stop_codon:yes gene_type:complete
MYYIRERPPRGDNLFPSQVWRHHTDKIDNRKLENIILEKEQKDKGVTFTNVGGYHSSAINLEKEKGFKCIYDYINECMEVILFENNYKPKLGILSSHGWVNINRKGDFNREHVHPDCHWSGVYYVKTPANCGELRFHNPIVASSMVKSGHLLNLTSSNIKTSFFLNSIPLDPYEGSILIFPSWLFHSVDPNRSNYDRISVSFNIKIMVPEEINE